MNKYIVEIPNTVISHIKATQYWSADDCARLLILHNKGLSNKEIAEQMNRTQFAIQEKLKKIRKKFAHMRAIDSYASLKKMASEAKKWNGCQLSGSCDNCPYPACFFDGYNPSYKVPVAVKIAKKWTPTEIQHWNELEFLPEKLDDLTLANIFRTSVAEIRKFRTNHSTIEK